MLILTISEEGEILIIKPEHLRLLYNTDNTVVAGMNFSLETQMWNKWNFFSVTELYFYFKPHLAASDNNLITGGQRSSSGLCLVRECVRCQDKEKQEMSGPQISGPARIQRRSLSILGFGFQSCGLGADKPGLKPPIMVSARLASQMPVASLLRCGRSLFQVALLPVHVQNSTCHKTFLLMKSLRHQVKSIFTLTSTGLPCRLPARLPLDSHWFLSLTS